MFCFHDLNSMIFTATEGWLSAFIKWFSLITMMLMTILMRRLVWPTILFMQLYSACFHVWSLCVFICTSEFRACTFNSFSVCRSGPFDWRSVCSESVFVCPPSKCVYPAACMQCPFSAMHVFALQLRWPSDQKVCFCSFGKWSFNGAWRIT